MNKTSDIASIDFKDLHEHLQKCANNSISYTYQQLGCTDGLLCSWIYQYTNDFESRFKIMDVLLDLGLVKSTNDDFYIVTEKD